MRQSIGRRIMACSLSVFLIIVLNSCGGKQAEAPELLEPVSGTESYREVVYGDVGTTDICYGTIVPTEHAHFWTTNVTIEDIKVDIGDYVNVGDVLATANLDAAQEKLDELSASLSLLQSTRVLQEKIHTLKQQKLTLQAEGCAAIGDTDGAANTETEIATEEENARYDKLLYEHQAADLQEQIEAQNKIIEDGTLVAYASGYVSYVRDIADVNIVDSTANVVVIADYDMPYIQVQDKTIKDELLEDYDSYYTMQNGEKELLREYAYSADEKMVAESQMKYPPLRMQYENENARKEIGTVIPIFLVANRTENVLLVGNDSLFEDETGKFVYVKNGDKREQRYVETGNSDYANTEIVSGLSEGEKVYYTSEFVLPENYEPYTAEIGDCEALVNTDRYTITDSVNKMFKSDYEGVVASVQVTDHANVKKGDLIAVIETNEGSAKLAEMRSAIDSTKRGYEDTKNAYDTERMDLEAQKQASALPVQPDIATGTDAEAATPGDAETEQQNPNETSMLDLEIQIADLNFQIQTLNYEKQLSDQEKEYAEVSCNNDGSGNCAIYAKMDGSIDGLRLWEGQKVQVGDTLYSVSVDTKPKLTLHSSADVPLGSSVTLTGKTSGNTVTGAVCGTGGGETCYLTTINHKVYATQSAASNGIRSYVELDDSSALEACEKYSISYVTTSIEDVIVIPADLVYTEEKRKYHSVERNYVWKMVDGNLEKQYVNVQMLDTTYDTGSYVEGDMKACVLDGLSEGDVLAREITDETEE